MNKESYSNSLLMIFNLIDYLLYFYQNQGTFFTGINRNIFTSKQLDHQDQFIKKRSEYIGLCIKEVESFAINLESTDLSFTDNKIFVAINFAFQLSEKYKDFSRLIYLSMMTNNLDNLDSYIIRFNDDGFAEFLFKMYLDSGGKFIILLSSF
jgi:hypothetical protein